MRKKNRFIIILLSLFLAGFSVLLFFLSDSIVQATHNPNGSNIYGCAPGSPGCTDDPQNSLHWAWNDIVGWIDFHTNDTVIVKSQRIEGYASSSVREISLDCATAPDGSGGKTSVCPPSPNYRVINDGCGYLSGWAWNEVYGWTSFCGTTVSPGSPDCPYNPNYPYQVSITTEGELDGYAWSDVIGWINFNCDNTYSGVNYCGTSNHKVKAKWVSTSTYAYLDSSTFDTGITGGAQLNSAMWIGDFIGNQGGCGGSTASVGFQIAASNSDSGPWNFVGPDNTLNSFYGGQSGTSIPLDYTLHNNQRYFRYRAFLFTNQAQSISPRVGDIIINWSP